MKTEKSINAGKMDNLLSSVRNQARDIRELENHSETREAIVKADLVIGFDRYSESYSFFYGTETLRGVIRTGIKTKLQVVSFLIDFDSDDLEYLYAAVQTLKGSCCYNEKN